MRKIKKLNSSDIFSRVGQIFGIAIICALYYAIVRELISSVLSTLREYPGDFWHNYIWLLIRNIGG